MSDTYLEQYGDAYGTGGGGGGTGPAVGESRLWVQVDWARNGQWTDVGDDVTRRVRAEAGISVSYGRDQTTALAPIVSGSGSFTLDNVDRRFSSRNTASPLYGKLRPARPVRVARQVDGVERVLFRGHTDDSPLSPDRDSRSVAVTLVDHLAAFRGQDISTRLYSGIRTGDAVGLILDACGWPAGLRDLDPGATVIPWWWEEGTDALTALEKVVRSEGPPALLTMGADGEVVFRDRHHRLLRAESLVSQQTWRSTGAGLVMARGFTYDDGWSTIVNTGAAAVDIRVPQQLQSVWSTEDTFSLDVGEERLITAAASDPFYGASVPVAGADFTVLDGSVEVELLRTSGQSATIKLAAPVEGTRITGLRLRAIPVPVTHTVQVSVSDPQSVAEYDARTFPGDLPWCGRHDARAVLQAAVMQRANPLPKVSARFVVGRDRSKWPLLGLDLSARVTILEPESGLNDPFYLEAAAHQLKGEHDHEVTFGLEAVATEPVSVARTDRAGVGADQGVAGGGLDDPDLLVIVDSIMAGHRVGEGVAST